MGPTAIVPYSNYWTVDHDENNDNICIEMLHPINMMSDPELEVRDRRLNDAIADTGWPLVRQVQTCVRQGSVNLMTQNNFHRRNRRRDSPEERRRNPRYMWRFMCYRTTEPEPAQAAGAGGDAAQLIQAMTDGKEDEMTGAVLDSQGEAAVACSVWESVLGWAVGEPPRVATAPDQAQVDALAQRLVAKGSAQEPVRIDAGYQLGAIAAAVGTPASEAAVAVLAEAMSHSWEGVRRAATHGLIAAGGGCGAAVEALLPLCDKRFPSKYTRKNAAFALGEMAYPTEAVIAALSSLLREDDSVHVRGTVATAIGGIGRRAGSMPGADAAARQAAAGACLEALCRCLLEEENRVGQDITQGTGPYDFKVTDESDLCEGASGLAGRLAHIPRPGTPAPAGDDEEAEAEQPRFERVRSGVMEAAGWGAVMLCTHGGVLSAEAVERAARELAEVVATDNNVIGTPLPPSLPPLFCVDQRLTRPMPCAVAGYALDALTRLARHAGPDSHARALADEAIAGADGWVSKEGLSVAMGAGAWRDSLGWEGAPSTLELV